MALMTDVYYDPFGEKAKAQEEAEKKRQAWLDELLEIKVKDRFSGQPHEDRVFYIKRRDLADLINASGVLDSIRDSCRQSELQYMRF
jgi:hypothetical protein